MAFATPVNNIMTATPTILLFFVLVFTTLRISACDDGVAPALYIMGSSLVDVGNNNYLPLTTARANFRHNGVDYPNGPTGRFGNGEISSDFIAKKMGLPTSPAYLSLTGGVMPAITGVNFASGGSGILNETGQRYVQVISLAQQIDYFSLVRDKLVQQLGPYDAQVHLSKSIFAIVIGNNEMINYFTAGSQIPLRYKPQQYIDLMLSTFKGLLKTLYGFGARKVLVFGVAAIGCYPAQRRTEVNGKCNAAANFWSEKYNDGLKVMLKELKSESLGLSYAYFELYGAMFNLFRTPNAYGFTNTAAACCGLGYLNADAPCIPTSTYCSNRRSYVFWDFLHPTEAVASMFSDIIYNGTQPYMVPINLKQLIDIRVN